MLAHGVNGAEEKGRKLQERFNINKVIVLFVFVILMKEKSQR